MSIVELRRVRDFGNVPTEDGTRVRSGLLYRSEAPATLDGDGRSTLASIPLRTVIDLRGQGEGLDFDGPWHPTGAPRRLYLEVVSANRALDPDIATAMVRDPSGATAETYMRDFFVDLIDAFADGPLERVAREVIDADQLPLLVHCTAGRDRTGMFVALMLSALGVDRQRIAADYVASNALFGPERVRDLVLGLLTEPLNRPFEPSTLAPLEARHEYLDLAFDHIAARYGSVANYWNHATGNNDVIAMMRARLTK